MKTYLLLPFTLLTFICTTAKAAIADSITVKGKAFGFDNRNAYCATLTIKKEGVFEIKTIADTAGNFEFKLPNNLNDTDTVTITLNYLLAPLQCEYAIKAYLVSLLKTSELIINTEFFVETTICPIHTSYEFAPPGMTIFTSEQIYR